MRVNPEIVRPANGASPVPSYVDAPAQHDGAVSVKLLLYAIFKRKWQVLAVIAVVSLSMLIAGLTRVKIYKVNAKVMIRPSRADLQVSPGDNREITLPVSATMEMLNSETEILKSAELMRQVLERMEQAGTPIFGADTDRSMGQQVAALRGMIQVLPAPQSNVISIDLYARDPEKGRAILAALTDTYLRRHAEVHGNRGATAFFEAQKKEKQVRVAAAEAALATFIERENIVVPEDQVRWAFKDAMRNRDTVRTQTNKITALERHIDTYRRQLRAMPERVLSDVERVNPAAPALGGELAQLEAKRAELLQLYNADDRMVTDVDAQLALLRRRLAESDATALVGRERLTANPVRQDIERALLNAERNLYDLRERVEELPRYVERQSAEDRERAIALRKKSIEYAALEAEVVAAREAYRLYERKQEEALISEALDSERILNVSVLDAPSVPDKPSNTMSPVMLAVAVIAGTGLGVGSAVGLEFVNRNFKLEEQVEQYLDLPVFAVIPDMSEVAERRA